ncbi:hypothetical protein [Kribbella endophytica]
MRILLDPAILIPPRRNARRGELIDFWDRILAWSSDTRIGVGDLSSVFAYDYYARFGYPENQLDELHGAPVRQEYRRAFNHLMARIIKHDREAHRVTLSPDYTGLKSAGRALEADATGTAGDGEEHVVAIGSVETNWDFVSGEVSFAPPPPHSLLLCFKPGDELLAETKGKIESAFVGMRVHIVGGKVDDRVLAQIADATGVSVDKIQWIESEKGKPPRKLRKQWSGLKPGKDITVCVTGRIGHSQSAVADEASAACGVPHLQVERASEIANSLSEYALRVAQDG